MKLIKIDKVPKTAVIKPGLTGVTMQPLVDTKLSKRFHIQQVNFGKGARNKFHAHTIEQILIVTKGKGIVATENEEVRVGFGDVIFIAAGEKHWHGATEGSTFSHITVMSPDTETTRVQQGAT